MIGDAHHVTDPLVALPPALDAAEEPPAAGEEEPDEPAEPDEEPLLHAAAASTTAAHATATCADRRLPRTIGKIFMRRLTLSFSA